MRIRRAVVMTLAVAGVMACGGSSDGPASPNVDDTEVESQTVADPAGDTFGTGVQWDLTALTVARDTGGVTVQLVFSSDVISPVTGISTAMVGFVDLDVDQDPRSGNVAIADEFRRDGSSTGIGADYLLVLGSYAADSSVEVVDSSAKPTGRVKPLFDGRRVTIRIPRLLLGNDDGFLNAAAIVGRTGSPSDIVPQSGHLTLGGRGQAMSSGSAARQATVRDEHQWGWNQRVNCLASACAKQGTRRDAVLSLEEPSQVRLVGESGALRDRGELRARHLQQATGALETK
jgi:hypothetical protein